MPGYYVIEKGLTGQFHFNLKSDNHEIILTSESYVSKQGAHTGIASCQLNSPYDTRYDKRTSAAIQPYFVLKAANGEIIGNSQMYSSVSARDNGIASCKINGPTTVIKDLS